MTEEPCTETDDSPLLRTADLPLLEHDPDPRAVVPVRPLRTSEPLPPRAVLCFFHEVLVARTDGGRARPIGRFSREVGGHVVHVVPSAAGPVAAVHPGVGAPLAAMHLEALVASGVRAVVACGGAGALRPDLDVGHVVVPTGAVRDEGTSFRYLPPAPTVPLDGPATATLVDVLRRHDRPWTTGLTWTTDGFYRETAARVARRRAEGCLTVEMETAALAAVATFRGIRFAQYLYAGDDVSGPEWDHRRWTRHEVRAELLDLAIEAVAELPV